MHNALFFAIGFLIGALFGIVFMCLLQIKDVVQFIDEFR